MESINDKLSIKTLLFTKAIPNHVLPVSTDAHKVYGCTDCGDKFIFESSYQQHINRKSVKISYTCRNNICSNTKVFYNRCNLLAHIRSHNFKTATINVSDLKVEPIPDNELNLNLLSEENSSASEIRQSNENTSTISCHECNEHLQPTEENEAREKTLSKHFMKIKNKDDVFTCPVCIFALPTICALKSHLRFHLKCPPHICPECGQTLSPHCTIYPYPHGCEGFRMMRVTTRVHCPLPDCHLCRPDEYKTHFVQNHLKKVFKCPFCFVACFSESIIAKHMKAHSKASKPFIFFQCEMCPGRLVLQDTLENHLKGHAHTENRFPCWACGSVFADALALVNHYAQTHDANLTVTNACREIFKVPDPSCKTKRIYRVVKRCDQCKSSFKYRCSFDQIKMLPNECPSKCTSASIERHRNITCGMCKIKMIQNWTDIKEHFSMHHKNHRCLDLNVVIAPLDTKKYKTKRNEKKLIKQKRLKKKRIHKNNTSTVQTISNNEVNGEVKELLDVSMNKHACAKCDQKFDNKKVLEVHLATHRDLCMAYQCMECGQCFAVKPTFSKHLLLEHEISDYEDYIATKNCYNELALMTHLSVNANTEEPLLENQCKICRQQFEDANDLEKHFRVHGMAFLMEKTNIKKK